MTDEKNTPTGGDWYIEADEDQGGCLFVTSTDVGQLVARFCDAVGNPYDNARANALAIIDARQALIKIASLKDGEIEEHAKAYLLQARELARQVFPLSPPAEDRRQMAGPCHCGRPLTHSCDPCGRDVCDWCIAHIYARNSGAVNSDTSACCRCVTIQDCEGVPA